MMANFNFGTGKAGQRRKIGNVASWPALCVIIILAAVTGFGGTSSCPTGPSESNPNSAGCATVDEAFSNVIGTANSTLSGLVYGAGDHGELYTITPSTGAVTAIGEMGTTMYDIAMYNGALYGVDATSNLYTISTTSGAVTLIGALGHAVNALTFSPTGVLYAAGGDTLYTVNTSSGHTTTVGTGTGGGTYASSGDLEFYNGVLYLTSSSTNGAGNDSLFKISTSTGQGTVVGSLGFTDVYGLAQHNGILYGFVDTGTAGQDVLTINVATGAGTKIGTYTLGGTPTNFGFDGTTDDGALPEPASFVLVGLGLATLVARFRSR